jgi:hypothetical protein
MTRFFVIVLQMVFSRALCIVWCMWTTQKSFNFPAVKERGQFFLMRKERFHRSGIQMRLHQSTSRCQVDCLLLWQNSFPCLTSDSAGFWHCVHNGHEKPDFFKKTVRLPISQHAGLFPANVASHYSFLRNFDPCVLHTPIPRGMWHTFTSSSKLYTLVLVCTVITSRQLHVVCI